MVGKYNQTWLRTEYDTAVRSARIAAQWKDMERTADLYPNVEFLRTRSAEPRQDHLDYVGIIRPLNDSWWDTHAPPLGWNCKCGIRSTDKPITPIPSNLTPIPEGLQNNPARSGNLFSENHPYAKNARREESVLKLEYKQSVAKMGLYYSVETPKGNIVLLHPGVEKNELKENLAAAVKITDFNPKMKVKVRPKIEGNGKQPDLEINGKMADLKTLMAPRNIKNAIQKQIQSAASQKCTYAVLDFGKFQPTSKELRDAIWAGIQPGRNSSIQELILIQDGIVSVVKRNKLNQK